MNTIITVIDRAFFQFDPSDSSLIISKPGHQVNGVYYPAESVTLIGVNLIEELLAFIRQIKQKDIHDDLHNKDNPAEYRGAFGNFLKSIPSSIPQCDTNNSGNLLKHLQDGGPSIGRNLPEEL